MKLWEMWSASLLPLLLDSLWTGLVVPVRVQSMGQMELSSYLLNLKNWTECEQKIDIKQLLVFDSNTCNHLVNG